MPRLDLSGSSALVTGGASGIGEACVRQLANAGAHVLIADLNEERGNQVAAETGGIFAKTDVTSEPDGLAAVAAASEMGPLRSVVNSAGIGWAARTVDRSGEPFDLGAFQMVVSINLVGTFNIMRLGAAAMARTEPMNEDGARGAIVNMASVAAFDGQIGQIAYSASKGGVVGMTLPAARDLSAIGVRVNTIAPGLIDTPIYGEGPESDTFKETLGESVLFPKRLGTSEELAFMVMECLTNPYVNGETIRLDAGVRLPPK